MKIFKETSLGGTYKNSSVQYQLLIHFALNAPGAVTLTDENGVTIESYYDSTTQLSGQDYPAITGSENLSTGAISYNAFSTTYAYSSASQSKTGMQKILVPPGYTVNNISSGLFIELEDLEELRGLI